MTTKKVTYLAIGLMSGTSMDGVDAALLATDGKQDVKPLAQHSLSYPKDLHLLLKAAEQAAQEAQGNLTQAAEYLNHSLAVYLAKIMQLAASIAHEKALELARQWQTQPCLLTSIIQHSTQFHLQAVLELLNLSGYQASAIDVIGYHGQTLYHAPRSGLSIQVGDGKRLAEQTGIPVINNFRRADIQQGGQGAPLAPLYHQALAAQAQLLPLAVVNCGGIANLTIIKGTGLTDIQAFDTGPGNVLLDRYIRQLTAGQEAMDVDGAYGLQGQVNTAVLKRLKQQAVQSETGANYLQLAPPKSLDSHQCQLLADVVELSRDDACATLAAFTAATIVDSLDFIQRPWPEHWVIAGGGWHNQAIRQAFKQHLQCKIGQAVQISTAQEVGWNNAAIEAECFAYLAVRSLIGLPLSTPTTTGVCSPVSGGELHRPPAQAMQARSVCV